MGRVTGPLRAEVVGVRFLGRIVRREWRLRRIGVRRGGGLTLGGQSRIRKGKVSRDRGLFGVTRMILRLG